MKKNSVLTIVILAALCLPAQIARAEPQCVREYEEKSLNYWRIVDDMLQLRVMFDNYDRLCSRYYPDEITALQDSADLLRGQVAADIKNVDRVIGTVFDDVLPQKVSTRCSNDKESRNTVKKAFLSTMKGKEKTLHARLERSALTLHNPGKDLKLCRDLKTYKPILEKKLGRDLASPLLEMSYYNSRYVTRDSGRRKEAYKIYRSILNDPSGKD